MPKGIPRCGHRASPKRHKDGKLVRSYQVTSRVNATPARFYVHYGTKSSILNVRLDGRSALGKALKKNLAELRAHLGPDISIPEDKLCNQAARLELLSDIAWSELMKAQGIVKGDSLHPSFTGFLKVVSQQRELLNLLGIKRPTKQVSLTEYLAEAGKEAA